MPNAEKDAHDAKCEREYTPSGTVFIDCLCHVRRAMAAAWDKGWNAGRRDWWNETRTTNPYRVTPSDVPTPSDGGEDCPEHPGFECHHVFPNPTPSDREEQR